MGCPKKKDDKKDDKKSVEPAKASIEVKAADATVVQGGDKKEVDVVVNFTNYTEDVELEAAVPEKAKGLKVDLKGGKVKAADKKTTAEVSAAADTPPGDYEVTIK